MSASFIETFTGQAFYPLAPNVEDIRIADIAHALSQQCRFAGHTRVLYSVAEHSVRVSRWLKNKFSGTQGKVRVQCSGTMQWLSPEEIQLSGLLHDGSEAFLVDLPTPLKDLPEFRPYRIAERRLMAQIFERFDLTFPLPDVVKEADGTLLVTEARDLMPYRKEHWGERGQQPLEEKIVPWTSLESEVEFLRTFAKLKRAA